MNIEEIVQEQRAFFATDATKSVPFRISALKKLKEAILKREQDIYAAMKADLNKSVFETYMTELGMVLDELRFMTGHTKKWAKRQVIHTPLAQFHSKSFKMSEPY